MTEAETTKEGDHLLQEDPLCAVYERQPSSQRRCEERGERHISCALPFVFYEVLLKLEVLEIREKSDKIQNLSTRTLELLEVEGSKSGR